MKYRWYQTVVISNNEDGGYRVYSSKARAEGAVISQIKSLFQQSGTGGNWKRRGLFVEIPGDDNPFHCAVNGCAFVCQTDRGCGKHIQNVHLL